MFLASTVCLKKDCSASSRYIKAQWSFHTWPYEINNLTLICKSIAIICPSFNSCLDKFTNYLKRLLSTIQYCEFSGVKTFTGYSIALSLNVSSISLHTKCGSLLHNLNIFLSNFLISISFSFVPWVHDLVFLHNHTSKQLALSNYYNTL